MRRGAARLVVTAAALASAGPAAGTDAPAAPVFNAAERAVSTWRAEAAEGLALDPGQRAALGGDGAPPPVARCVKLNNYWCIKRAGWTGEIASDGEGHVAFATATEGAAVAALLLRRYYVDFGRHSAFAIVSRWAPAQCGDTGGGGTGGGDTGGGRAVTASLTAVAGTLRARWLAGHSRGFAAPTRRLAGATRAPRTAPRRSVVADRVSRPEPAPTIALGVGGAPLGERPAGSPPGGGAVTLDALLSRSPDAPPSRSMLGMARRPRPAKGGTKDGSKADTVLAGGGGPGCAGDAPRIAAYAAAAGAGVAAGPDGDLGLFGPDGAPTANLATVMANMARVEIGPLGARPELIAAGIADAFRARQAKGK